MDIKEEEQKLMSGSKYIENKDDFWITLWEQLQKRADDGTEEEQK